MVKPKKVVNGDVFGSWLIVADDSVIDDGTIRDLAVRYLDKNLGYPLAPCAVNRPGFAGGLLV